MNPLVESIIGSGVRWALALAVPFLVSWKIWTPEEATQFSVGLVAAGTALIWSIIQKYGARVKVVNAMRAPANSSEDVVDAMPRPPVVAQKVLSFVMAVILAGSITACATGSAQQIAHYGAQITQVAVQAQNVVVAADKSGLQPNKDLTAKAMAAFGTLGEHLQKLADGLRLYDSLGGTAKDDQAKQVRALLVEARRLTRVVLQFTGGNEQVGKELLTLFDQLDLVIDEVMLGLKK